MADQTEPDLAREQWRTDIAFRERELTLKERESGRAIWSNPLALAIFAAAVAAAGNGVVTWMNDRAQRDLEERKAEAARILEVVKTGDPDKAAKNLQFLIDTGLIADPERLNAMKAYLAIRKPGEGPFVGAAAVPAFDPSKIPTFEESLTQEEADLKQKEKGTGTSWPASEMQLQFDKKALGDHERQLRMPVQPPAQ
jgi:hypothetical protein